MQNTEQKTITSTEHGQNVTYHLLATVEELDKTGQITRWIDGHDILLYRYEGALRALSNICRHFGGPVGYYKEQDGVFTCLWHNWQYDAKDGSCITYPGFPLRQYSVKTIGSNIYVNLVG